MSYLYLLGTVVFTVYGQLIIKWRIGIYGALPDTFFSKILFLFKLLLDPFILSGFFAAFIASFFWMAAMTRFDVSYAYPIIVGGLVIFTSFFAILFLKEPVSLMKVAGLVLIVAGIYLLGRGA